jgi:hypothetical protein
MKPVNKTIWVLLFAIAMGYLESAVVVYLRALYYPEGFDFPLKEMSQVTAITEIYREAATLIMILAVSVLAAENWLRRFAWFLLVFATWDIAYYIFLKLLIGWPGSLLTSDILFLLPSIWTGPVIAPVINSVTMLLLALAILFQWKGSVVVIKLSRTAWVLLLAGTLIVMATYMKDFANYMMEQRHLQPSGEVRWSEFMMIQSSQFIPVSFDWLLFGVGVSMHIAAIFLVLKSKFKPPVRV